MRVSKTPVPKKGDRKEKNLKNKNTYKASVSQPISKTIHSCLNLIFRS